MEAGPDLLTLAKERFAVRDYHGATLLLTSLTEKGTRFADAYNLLGLSLAMVDRPWDALGAFDEALQLNPRYVEAYLNRAVLLNELGRTEAAEADIARAAELGAADSSGFPARTLLEQGRPEEASQALEDLLDLRPNCLNAMLLKGLAAYLAGDLDTAGTVWDEASIRHPEEPRLEIYRSMLARRRTEMTASDAN